MKKSVIVLLSSLTGWGVMTRAQPTELEQINISSANATDIYRASVLVGEYFVSIDKQPLKVEFDPSNGTASIQVRRFPRENMNVLVDKMKEQFGDSVLIRKVDVRDMTKSSQDGWMTP
jgi:hypothetical protein